MFPKMRNSNNLQVGIPVFVSQLIESTADSLMPSKSEVASVTSAILDGADCLVFDEETSTGKYPVNSVKILSKICIEVEAAHHYKRLISELTDISFPIEPTEAICMSAVDVSIKTNAAVIIVCTVTGRSARLLAKYRPRCPVIAITRSAQVARHMNIYRAVYPLIYLSIISKNILIHKSLILFFYRTFYYLLAKRYRL